MRSSEYVCVCARVHVWPPPKAWRDRSCSSLLGTQQFTPLICWFIERECIMDHIVLSSSLPLTPSTLSLDHHECRKIQPLGTRYIYQPAIVQDTHCSFHRTVPFMSPPGGNFSSLGPEIYTSGHLVCLCLADTEHLTVSLFALTVQKLRSDLHGSHLASVQTLTAYILCPNSLLASSLS